MIFKYPEWIKLLIGLCLIVCVGWALAAVIYPLIRPQPDLMSRVAILASSLLPFYFSYKLMTLLPWLNISIVVLDDGFIIKRAGGSRKFLWEDVGSIEFSGSVKVCKIFTKRKELICVLYFEHGSISIFVDMLRKNIARPGDDDAGSYASDLRRIFQYVKKYHLTRKFFFLSFIGVVIDSHYSTFVWSSLVIIMMVVYGAMSLKIASEKCPRCKNNYFGSLFWDETADSGLLDIENAECKNCGLSMSLIRSGV